MGSRTNTVLIVDDDPSTALALGPRLRACGLAIETARDAMAAIDKLRRHRYAAIVISPLIRRNLNGFVVLSYIEEEQREILPRVFLLTVLPYETIKRIAPAVASRLFSKSADDTLVQAIVACCGGGDLETERTLPSVLLAEDDAETARIEKEILQELGYSCRWVSTGVETLDALNTADFDALLLDVVMPDIDGAQILAMLQEKKPDLLQRVIVVTGLPGRYLDDLRHYPVRGILQKPVDPRGLRELLDNAERVGDR
jgi:CheY-like chemotaxis protein